MLIQHRLSPRGGESVKTYRVYCFDGASRITSADWIDAVNDADAVQAAKKFDCFRVEVWDHDRLVGRRDEGLAIVHIPVG